jgi:hypothetical protein
MMTVCINKAGATDFPFASISFFADAFDRSPMNAIVSAFYSNISFVMVTAITIIDHSIANDCVIFLSSCLTGNKNGKETGKC